MNDYKQSAELILHEFYSAFNLKNWESFSTYLSDDFSYISDNMTVMNKDGFLKFLENDSYTGNKFEINNISTLSSGDGNMVSLVYKIIFNGNMNNNEIEIQAAETAVFKNFSGELKIVHLHVSNKF